MSTSRDESLVRKYTKYSWSAPGYMLPAKKGNKGGYVLTCPAHTAASDAHNAKNNKKARNDKENEAPVPPLRLIRFQGSESAR